MNTGKQANQLSLGLLAPGSKETSVEVYNPLPMQYLGGKGRIASWILQQIRSEYPNANGFIDLFAGTGVVSLEALRLGYQVSLNDLQPYTQPVLKSIFTESRQDLVGLLPAIAELKNDSWLLKGQRVSRKKLLSQETEIFKRFREGDFDWEKYREFSSFTKLVSRQRGSDSDTWNLFSNYYPNTYFGVRQCLALDTLREYAETLEEPLRTHVIAATISVMTFAVSSTTHLAQFLKPTNEKNSRHIAKRRQVDIHDEVMKRVIRLSNFRAPFSNSRVLGLDYVNALSILNPGPTTIVYADPPYFKEHYSRYYHVLDTFYLYDYPALTMNPQTKKLTMGRYRENRLVSEFGKKAKVREAFKILFRKCSEGDTNLVLSYAETSLVQQSELVDIAASCGLHTKVKEIMLMHSGQGQPRNKKIRELLFLFSKK